MAPASVTMTTQIEQATNDLLQFSGKFKVKKGKIKSSAVVEKKTSARSSRHKEWKIRSSEFAMKTHNPIRALVDGLKIEPNKDKQMIALSIGEFTEYSGFLPLRLYVIVEKSIEKLRRKIVKFKFERSIENYLDKIRSNLHGPVVWPGIPFGRKFLRCITVDTANFPLPVY